LEYVENLLKEKGVEFKYQGQDLLVRCFNPEHIDSTPSMRIDKVDGRFNCFSCGFKGRSIFEYYGILTNNVSIRIAKLKEKIRNLQLDLFGLEYPVGHTPYNIAFRGISRETLKKFGAFYTNQVEELADRIVFPLIDISGNISVFVARHTLSDAQPRYVNYPRGRTLPIFPIQMEKGTRSIVLVEGIFDFLNCYDKGLTNTVCTFGTQTLKANIKGKLLPFKIQGIQKIYIMFDGDKAGQDAARALQPLIEENEIEVEIINLPDGTDPGDLDQEYISSIKEYVNK